MPPLIAIPNVSEGRDAAMVESLTRRMTAAGAIVLDRHTDAMHNRTVYTLTSPDVDRLIHATVDLADAVRTVDLTEHTGVHPRLGGLDVCPFVPVDASMQAAVDAACSAAEAIARRTGSPVYLYGEAARRAQARRLPDIRRGGLDNLIERAGQFPPDFGPRTIDPARGVVCVGARGPLIAFNVWIDASVSVARRIATHVRDAAGGPDVVRCLGLDMDGASRSQVSMNLIAPARFGIDDAFALVERGCLDGGIHPFATEIVGLVPLRLSPDPNGKAARLLIKPGRSLESALAEHGLGAL